MLDSLLTLTKGEALWMAIGFVTAALAHWAVVALTGEQEPIFLLIALLIPVVLVITGGYTLAKKILHR